LRIARVLTRMNLGGPSRQVLSCDPLLRERGHAVRLFVGEPAPGEGDLTARAEALGIECVRVPGLAGGSVWGLPLAARFLRGALARFHPDILHSHTSKAGWAARRAVRDMNDLARVHTFHGHVLEGYFPAFVNQRLIALERKLAERTDRILAVSHATAEDLLRLRVAPQEKITVVPPGVDLSELLAISARSGALRERLGVREGDFLLGVVGRLAAVKRPEWALSVAEQLAPRFQNLHLVFVGDGDLRGLLVRRIRALPHGLQERVHLVGALEEMAPAYADMDAVLLCSRSEGLPIALIEAAAAKLPVVATRVGGVPELVAEERTGYLGDSVDELAFGVARLIENRNEAVAMGARARLRASARHGAEGLAQRLEQVYRAVLQERACAC
jgi:glycosyltransferase involved in cell wall biosynthesis